MYYISPHVGSKDKPCASDLLAFVSSCAAIPPLGFKDCVTIQYLPFDSGKKLPEAASCFCILYLLVCNQSKEEFVASFDEEFVASFNKALVLGRVGL